MGRAFQDYKPGRGKNISSFTKIEDLIFGPRTFIYNGYRGSIPKVKLPEHEADRYPPSSAEFKNEIIYILFPHNFTLAAGIAHML